MPPCKGGSNAVHVRTIENRRAGGWEKVVDSGRVRSLRYVTAADRVGFSLHLNVSESGDGRQLWYKHHWEANYIISGEATLEDLDRGDARRLRPGSLYTVGPTDRHRLVGQRDICLASVFCPALRGEETHDADGAYSPSGEVPPGPRQLFVVEADLLRDAGHEKTVANGEAQSLRMLTGDDQVGFSLSDVYLEAGARASLWYKHHWEANLVIGGRGGVVDVGSGREWPLSFGTMYLVGPKDRHVLRADEDMHILSVFCPPLRGDEAHDADGALAPSGPVPPGPDEHP